MKLLRVDERPTTGQFVAIWMHNGKPWSDTFMYDDFNLLHVFDSAQDEFIRAGSCAMPLTSEIHYYICLTGEQL